jgi:HK97 family phage major capsid protein
MLQHTLHDLEAWLGSIGPVAMTFRNEPAPKIEDLQRERLDTFEEIEAIQAKADGESRKLTDDEKTELDHLWAKFEELEDELGRREKIANASSQLSQSLGRQTEPGDTVDANGEQPRAAVREPRRPSARVSAAPRNSEEAGRWGWPSFGHFASAVRAASRPGNGSLDPRLVSNAPTTFGTEGVGEEGGFPIPPDFRTAIMEKVMSEDSLLGRTDRLTSGSNTATIPVDETTPWQTSGGFQAFWEGEGSQLTQSKPQLEPRSIRLNKLTALVPVTDELLEDAPLIDSYLRRKVPEKMDYSISEALFNGSGVGRPRGLMQSGALISVAKEGSQAADTVVFENINKMYSRMYAPWRANAVWMINQDIEPQLNSLNHPGDSSPVFMPPGGLSQSPFGTILGKPVVPHQVCKTLGDLGDIVLVDWSQYMTIRKTGGLRAETSVHLFFDYDMTAFRFIIRLAGMPWWDKTISPANGANTLSWAVALAERA